MMLPLCQRKWWHIVGTRTRTRCKWRTICTLHYQFLVTEFFQWISIKKCNPPLKPFSHHPRLLLCYFALIYGNTCEARHLDWLQGQDQVQILGITQPGHGKILRTPGLDLATFTPTSILATTFPLISGLWQHHPLHTGSVSFGCLCLGLTGFVTRCSS